ncbi:thymidylate kinase [Bacteroidia bacterium]|nr:thymidylate kinase [Bacteroidia bacterium]
MNIDLDKKKGKLIVVFGIDGSGKTTLMSKLKEYYPDNGTIVFYPCIKKAKFVKEIRDAKNSMHYLKDSFSKAFSGIAHINDIVYNVLNFIEPLLNSNVNVVLDRYSICSRVFLESGAPEDYFVMSKMMSCLPVPDLGIYLDITVEEAMSRIVKRAESNGKPISRHDNIDALINLKKLYSKIMREEEYKIVTVDANNDSEYVLRESIKAINELLQK